MNEEEGGGRGEGRKELCGVHCEQEEGEKKRWLDWWRHLLTPSQALPLLVYYEYRDVPRIRSHFGFHKLILGHQDWVFSNLWKLVRPTVLQKKKFWITFGRTFLCLLICTSFLYRTRPSGNTARLFNKVLRIPEIPNFFFPSTESGKSEGTVVRTRRYVLLDNGGGMVLWKLWESVHFLSHMYVRFSFLF